MKKYSHYTIEEIGSLLRIKISTPRPKVMIILFCFFLVIWAILIYSLAIPWLVSFIGSFPSSITPYSIIITTFVLFLVFIGLRNGFLFFRFLGKEIIEIDDHSLTSRIEIKPIRLSEKFNGEYINNLRLSRIRFSQEYQSWPREEIWWHMDKGVISFDYKYKEVRLGKYLSDEEAIDIVTEIRKRFPQYCESA